MSDKKPRPTILWITAALALLPIVYIFSMGPLIWLETRGRLRGPLLQVAVPYAAPYNWACDHLPDRLRPVLESYERLWAK